MRVLRLLAIAVSAAWLLAGAPAFAQAPPCPEASPLYIGTGPGPGACCEGSGLESASSPGTIMPGGGSAFGGIGSYTMAGSALHPAQPDEVCAKPEGTLRGSCGAHR